MIPLIMYERPGIAEASRARELLSYVEWVDKIFERMPAEMTGYLDWPRDTMETVRREIEALHAGTHRSIKFTILSP